MNKEMNDGHAPAFHTDHNVYILGAGYSAEAGLPVMSNFLSVMQKVRMSAAISPDEEEAIDAVLQFRLESASAAHRINLDLDNIESLFSLTASSSIIGGNISARLEKISNQMQIAIGATINHCQKKFYSLSIEQKKALNFTSDGISKPIDFFDFSTGVMSGTIGTLKKQKSQENTIITFNYDTLLEDYFNKNGVEFSYGEGMPRSESPEFKLFSGPGCPSSIVKVLKLHGSINWSSAGSKGDSGLDVHMYKDYDELRSHSEDRKPTLLPPWWKKDPNGFTISSWANAVEQLQTASRIIIIGYSLPTTDQYVKYLLAAGLSKNISLTGVWVVNKRPDVFNSIREIFSSSYNGIVDVQPMSAESFFFGNSGYDALLAINRKPIPT
ncbi:MULTISPECIES: SIR2 family protein [Acidithiobacillus]|uniref:Uncharacterized protein n=4 Tax=Acidithiobacillus TaxID=119977 RepID=A0A179BLV5_ACIFR|nr:MULTISPECIES: SIR2 family protein [Acidithiobacillus]MBU2832662.1 hypothetical protein [Acidithiobacillus ferriphilus]MBU2852669.1 hypothetical protein [Acidithiobacillus ferriphilus]MEB8486348.1 SIR2 family protein [Acidithiobacillus ferriphilus]MEB8490064.1 SIR2 family protein [Acidithiobacillus ferriphilus]MEB8493814.1 SIR2 family protein [Acidithiobacillus ferriphilus]